MIPREDFQLVSDLLQAGFTRDSVKGYSDFRFLSFKFGDGYELTFEPTDFGYYLGLYYNKKLVLNRKVRIKDNLMSWLFNRKVGRIWWEI